MMSALPDYQEGIRSAGIEIDICIEDIQAEHPNTYQIKLSNSQETRRLTALSTGGGMIEVIKIDGAEVSMLGDYYETLVYVSHPGKVKDFLQASVAYDEIDLREGRDTYFEIKSQGFLPEQIVQELDAMEEVLCIKQLTPVLPILSRQGLKVPFLTCEEMLAYNQEKELALWELALHYESARGDISQEEVYERMRNLVDIMRTSIQEGLQGTEYADRILGCQSGTFQEKMKEGGLVKGRCPQPDHPLCYVHDGNKEFYGGHRSRTDCWEPVEPLPGAVLGAVSALELSEDEGIQALCLLQVSLAYLSLPMLPLQQK